MFSMLCSCWKNYWVYVDANSSAYRQVTTSRMSAFVFSIECIATSVMPSTSTVHEVRKLGAAHRNPASPTARLQIIFSLRRPRLATELDAFVACPDRSRSKSQLCVSSDPRLHLQPGVRAPFRRMQVNSTDLDSDATTASLSQQLGRSFKNPNRPAEP